MRQWLEHLFWDGFYYGLLQSFLSFSSQVTSILKYLFPVPKDDSKRIISFANQDDYISFRYVMLVLCSTTELMMGLCAAREVMAW